MFVSKGIGKAAAVTAAALLIGGAAACGSGDDDGGGGDAAAVTDAAPSYEYPVGGDNDATVQRLVEDVQARMRAADPKVCESLAPRAQRDMARVAGSLGFPEQGCEATIVRAFGPSKEQNSKQEPSKVVGVRSFENRAVARVTRPKSAPYEVVAVNVDGEWKMSSLGFDQGAE